MSIDPQGWNIDVARAGAAIEVRFANGAVTCPGEPTVFDVDVIEVTQSGATFDLRAGPLAPGATDEGDGSSEVEIELSSDLGPQATFLLGSSADRVRLGTVRRGLAGINLNAGEDTSDADVTFHGDRSATVSVYGGGGGDRMSANGGAGFEDPVQAPQVTLFGEFGKDRLVGSPRADALVGGPGPDVLIGLAGSDTFDARRGGRDRVRCGPGGSDSVFNDPRDSLSACELTGQ